VKNCGSSIDGAKYTGLNFTRITVFVAEMFSHFQPKFVSKGGL